MPSFFRIILIFIIYLCPAAGRTEECKNHLQTTINPISIDFVIRDLARLPNTKGEFETTVEYEARLRSLIGSIPTKFIVKTGIDPNQIDYDADTKILSIKSYAIDNTNTRYDDLFGYGTSTYGKIRYVRAPPIDIVISETEKDVGAYKGTNSFGANIMVRKIKRSTKVIFDRFAEYNDSLFFSSSSLAHSMLHIIVQFPDTAPGIARTMKATMQAALVIAPKAPYYAKGKVNWAAPTIQFPRDIDETLEVVIADIQCVLLTDQTGLVFAAIPTR